MKMHNEAGQIFSQGDYYLSELSSPLSPPEEHSWLLSFTYLPTSLSYYTTLCINNIWHLWFTPLIIQA